MLGYISTHGGRLQQIIGGRPSTQQTLFDRNNVDYTFVTVLITKVIVSVRNTHYHRLTRLPISLPSYDARPSWPNSAPSELIKRTVCGEGAGSREAERFGDRFRTMRQDTLSGESQNSRQPYDMEDTDAVALEW